MGIMGKIENVLQGFYDYDLANMVETMGGHFL